MNRLRQLREEVSSIFEASMEVILMMALLALGAGFITILSPMFTLLFVGIGTFHAVENRQGAKSIGGLILHLASWPAVDVVGQFLGILICTLGLLLWFGALLLSFECVRREHVSATTR